MSRVHFTSRPPFGSDGLQCRHLAPDVLEIDLGHAPGNTRVPNCLQGVVTGAADRDLQLRVRFAHAEPRSHFDEYFHSVTPDFGDFRVLRWEREMNGRENVLRIPATGWGSFHLGMQFPFPLEPLSDRMRHWGAHPHARREIFCRSLEDRPVERLVVSDPEERPRFRHLVANQHPGEGAARWRIAGMIDWLLSDDPAAVRARREAEWSFIPLLCPDGPAHGIRRAAVDGTDMNRCYRYEGPDVSPQPPEAASFQRFLEDHTPHTLVCMHTWPGITEPILDGIGPELAALGGFKVLRDCLAANTDPSRMKPLSNRETPGTPGTWNHGARTVLGITTLLVEGGGSLVRARDHLDAGRDLARAMADCWRSPPPQGCAGGRSLVLSPEQ